MNAENIRFVFDNERFFVIFIRGTNPKVNEEKQTFITDEIMQPFLNVHIDVSKQVERQHLHDRKQSRRRRLCEPGTGISSHP